MHVVIRFSSLGDIVLTSAVTKQLAPVLFVTSRRFEQLASSLPGVCSTVCLDPGQSLGELARAIKKELAGSPFRGVDLHASLRSRLLRLRLGGSWRTLPRATIRRHLRPMLKLAPATPVVHRYGIAAGVAPVRPHLELKEQDRDLVVLVPGAAHLLKQWPAERFIELGKSLEQDLVVAGGPGEEQLCERIAKDLGAECLCERGFDGVMRLLPRTELVVAGDTGLAHLFAAGGARALVIFCSTAQEDGFWEDRCVGISRDLACRPCSRFGADICPHKDSACLDVGLSTALEALG